MKHLINYFNRLLTGQRASTLAALLIVRYLKELCYYISMNQEIESIKKYVRAANYLSAAQIYLQDNFALERRLKFDDIKPRLLGHWGTCPGINFVYANLNNLIKKHEAEMI